MHCSDGGSSGSESGSSSGGGSGSVASGTPAVRKNEDQLKAENRWKISIRCYLNVVLRSVVHDHIYVGRNKPTPGAVDRAPPHYWTGMGCCSCFDGHGDKDPYSLMVNEPRAPYRKSDVSREYRFVCYTRRVFVLLVSRTTDVHRVDHDNDVLRSHVTPSCFD